MAGLGMVGPGMVGWGMFWFSTAGWGIVVSAKVGWAGHCVLGHGRGEAVMKVTLPCKEF